MQQFETYTIALCGLAVACPAGSHPLNSCQLPWLGNLVGLLSIQQPKTARELAPKTLRISNNEHPPSYALATLCRLRGHLQNNSMSTFDFWLWG
jgi:hypothetical protein